MITGTLLSLLLIYVSIKFPKTNMGFVLAMMALVASAVMPDFIPVIDEAATLAIAISKLMGRTEVSNNLSTAKSASDDVVRSTKQDRTKVFTDPSKRDKVIEAERSEIGDIWETK